MEHLTQRKILLALGANLPSAHGPPAESLRAAIRMLDRNSFRLMKLSSFYANPAFPAGSGPDFVNAAAIFDGAHTPQAVLDRLHDAESAMGRSRNGRWTARSIDIDLIAVDDLVLPDARTARRWIDLDPDQQRRRTPDTLILPHPRLQDRAFVLVPAAEILPDWRHPLLGQTLAELRDGLPAAARADLVPLSSA